MNCDEMAAHLTELMEGGLDRDTEAAALEHLASCAACTQVLADTEATVDLLAEHGGAVLDDEVRARLVASVLDAVDPDEWGGPDESPGR